jgi:hypothetical protein
MKKMMVLWFLLVGMMSFGQDKQVIIPSGTTLMMKTVDPIDGRQHGVGHKFSGVLEGDIIVEDKVVVKSGSKVYGTIIESETGGRLVGKSSLSFKLTQIMVDNKLVKITTNHLNYIGKEGSGKDTAKKAARGAAIGGLIDGSDGAKTGVAVGVGAAILTKGGSIKVPSGTYLDFTIDQDTVL